MTYTLQIQTVTGPITLPGLDAAKKSTLMSLLTTQRMAANPLALGGSGDQEIRAVNIDDGKGGMLVIFVAHVVAIAVTVDAESTGDQQAAAAPSGAERG